MTAPTLTEEQYGDLLSAITGDYSARKLAQAAYAAGWKARGERDMSHIESMRDCILHERGPMAESGMDSDHVNCVLGVVDDHIAAIRKEDAE